MSSRVKKRRDKLVRKMFEGTISEDEARRRAGGKYARKAAQADLVKMQRAQAEKRAQADHLTGMVKEAFAAVLKSAGPLTEDDLRAAASAPMPRPAVTAAPGAAKVRRRDPQRDAMLLKSHQAREAEVPAAAPQQWTGVQKALRHQAEYGDDPFAREAARQALVNEGMLPGTPQEPAVKTARGTVWAPGADGTFGWQPMPEPRPLDFGIVPPRT